MSDHLLLEMITELKKLNADNRLWTVDDIAAYLQFGKTTVSQKIITAKDFPKPIKANGTNPRWIHSEVKDWARRQRH